MDQPGAGSPRLLRVGAGEGDAQRVGRGHQGSLRIGGEGKGGRSGGLHGDGIGHTATIAQSDSRAKVSRGDEAMQKSASPRRTTKKEAADGPLFYDMERIGRGYSTISDTISSSSSPEVRFGRLPSV